MSVPLFDSWRARIAVEGRSMVPTLLPGDWILVDPDAYLDEAPVAGDLVLVPDPRDPARMLVKRVAHADRQGRLEVRGDSPDESTDSRAFGRVAASSVEGRPWFRYWPLSRVGRIG